MPQDKAHDDGKGSLGRRILASLASSAYHAAEPHVKKAVEEGSLVRWAKELIQSSVQPLSDNASHYSPLPTPSSTRLFTIHPGDANSRIRCSLRMIDLKDSPKYIALSYSWGKDKSWSGTVFNYFSYAYKHRHDNKTAHDLTEINGTSPESSRTILCNDRIMVVYENLYDALLQLRKSSPGDYWIDAVCINQSDLAERSAQVQMMDRIYSGADKVTVWLGACPQMLSRGAGQLEKMKGDLPPLNNTAPLFQAALGESNEGAVVSAALYLVQRRYFRRLWVLQELCLAKNIELYFGEHRMSSETLVGIIQWAQGPTQEDDINKRRVLSPMAQAIRPLLSNILLIPRLLETRARLQQGVAPTLEQWLELTKGREASDPRDFINGGLSLLKSEDLRINKSLYLRDAQDGPDLWERLEVNYDASTTEVLRNVAACLLSQPGGIKLLSIASRVRDEQTFDDGYVEARTMQSGNNVPIVPPNRHGDLEEADDELKALPSWIPSPNSWSSRFLDTFSSQGVAHLAACTSLENRPQISSDGTTLHIDAAKLGVIKTVRQSPIEWDWSEFLEFATAVPAQYMKGERGLEALAETCLAGTWLDRPGDALRAFIQHLKIGMSDITPDKKENAAAEKEKSERAYKALEAKYPKLLRSQQGAEQTKRDAQLERHFHHDSQRLASWRSLFITRNGYLGLGPSWLAEGDQVMLVKGGYVPYIFRHVDQVLTKKVRVTEDKLKDKGASLSQTEREALQDALRKSQEQIGRKDAWVLIGEAYVRGVMEGQAVTPATEFGRVSVV